MSDYISSKDTLIQILKYLPVRSLVRFRCVCKWWKEIVDCHEFMEEHLAIQKPRFLVECNDEPDFVAVELRSLPTLPLVHMLTSPIEGIPLSIFGSLHGVVCLSDWDDENILLWNPSIRKFSSIPLPLDFNSSICEAWCGCYGFWIDPSTKEFKISIMLFDMDEWDNPVDVNGILYSSIKQDWTVVPPAELDRDWAPVDGVPAVMIGGVAHWKGSYAFRDDRTAALLCFDFRQESFEFIDMPNLQTFPHSSLMPIQWKGTLAVLHWHENFSHRCEIYARQEGSWINMFRFNICSPETRMFCVEMMGAMEERFWALFTTKPNYITRKVGGFYHYNLSLYDSRVGCIPLMDDVRYGIAYDFVESLLFP